MASTNSDPTLRHIRRLIAEHGVAVPDRDLLEHYLEPRRERCRGHAVGEQDRRKGGRPNDAFSREPTTQCGTGVVQTGNGWEIIQALERDESRPVDPQLFDEMRRRHFGDWLAAAEGSPDIDRQLTPEKTDWVLQRAGKR